MSREDEGYHSFPLIHEAIPLDVFVGIVPSSPADDATRRVSWRLKMPVKLLGLSREQNPRQTIGYKGYMGD